MREADGAGAVRGVGTAAEPGSLSGQLALTLHTPRGHLSNHFPGRWHAEPRAHLATSGLLTRG